MKMSNSLYLLIISLVLMIFPLINRVSHLIENGFTGNSSENWVQIGIFFGIISIYFLIDEKLKDG